MFANLTTQLDTILSQIELVVKQNTSRITVPLLTVHPPGLREAYATFIESRQNDMSLALTALLDVETRAAALRTKIHTHQRTSAFPRTLVSALPNEILCAIFSFAVHSDVAITDRSLRPISIAIALSNVCRNWHVVAASLHSLWTSLILFEGDLRRADGIIRRSVKEPLDVNFTEDEFSPSDYMRSEFQKRIKRLSIPCGDNVENALTRWLNPDGSFYKSTALESLALVRQSPTLIRQSIHWERKYSSIPYNYQFPKLRRLRLDGIRMFHSFQAKHLTTLEISDISIHDFTSFLGKNTRLQTLVVERIYNSQSLAPIEVLGDLTHLDIRNMAGPHILDVLSCFSAPHLESFDLWILGDDNAVYERNEYIEIETGFATEVRKGVRRKLGQLVGVRPIDLSLYFSLSFELL